MMVTYRGKMIHKKERFVIPSVDLGGTKIAFAFMRADKQRKTARVYPPTDVVKIKNRTDAGKTLELIARLIKKRTREMERMGWVVLKLVGMGAPGLHLEDGSVDPKSVPNIPGLAKTKPAVLLEEMLGKEWKVFINNDGAVQAVASADAFVRSPDYKQKWAKIIDETGGKIIYFGPGTGFGAGKIFVHRDKKVTPMPGSQAFFDTVIRDGKTAEHLIGGYGIGKIAQLREKADLERGIPAFLKMTEGYETWRKDPDKKIEEQLGKITGEVVARAYDAGDKTTKKKAKEIFVQAGRDLAKLMIQLHKGRGKKTVLEWDKRDWDSVKGTGVFLVAGLLIKPTGKELILPSARAALKDAGYAKKIKIIEMDQLPTMKNMKGRIGIFGASLIIPEKEILARKAAYSLNVGKNRINRYISNEIRKTWLEKQRPVLLAIDGYSGIEWNKSISQIKQRLEKDGMKVTIIDFASSYRSRKKIEKIIQPYMTENRTFGRIFHGKLEDFIDQTRVENLKERFENYLKTKAKSPRAILCFGPGAACKQLIKLYDLVFYRDIIREEITRRSRKGLVMPLGASGKNESRKGQPAYLAGKRFHYVDFPLLDRHKKSIQKRIDFYIDDNLAREPKLIDRKILDELISHLAQGPFQLKAFHDEGVWGGQWLKKVRKLPDEMVNCAWAYELMAYHMSVKIPVKDTFIETPFANLLDREPDRIMGGRVRRRFKGIWPIRVNYDDCWEGGDMAIQIHPDASYIKKNFREPLHQDESYYIMAATPDAYVYLGLKKDIETDKFYEAVRKAETEGIPFDHRQYVNVFPAREGDLFLIPAGTVHASGKGCVVLELSSTTDRYTFHFYDYLRPDLNGKLRDIHSKHAFDMMHKYPHRTTPWVKKHLMQKPRLIRKGKGWAEYLIGKLEGIIPEIHRIEMTTTLEDDTSGVPHVLSLVKGKGATIQSRLFPERRFDLNFSETVIIPACFGKYAIVNRDNKSCKILKTLVNPSWLKNH